MMSPDTSPKSPIQQPTTPLMSQVFDFRSHQLFLSGERLSFKGSWILRDIGIMG